VNGLAPCRVGRRQNQPKVETMEAASPRIPTFGNNPGNFRRQISITFTGVLVRTARCDYANVTIRLQQYFESVEVFDLHTLDLATNGLCYGIRPNDVAFICRQPRGANAKPASSATTFTGCVEEGL